MIGRSLPDLKVAYTLPAPRGDFTDLEVDEAAGTGLVVATELTAGGRHPGRHGQLHRDRVRRCATDG